MFLVVFATFVTMRFYAMKVFCFVLLFSTLSYQANISKQVNEKANLQDEKVDANSIVSDLKSGKRGVFAIGNVGSQLTLFVSGSGSTNSPSGGYQVAVSESKGAFKITGTPVPVPSGIPSDAAVIFYCKDSGDNLVAMNSKSVGVLPLPSGSYEPAKMNSHEAGDCLSKSHFYVSSTESLKYFFIGSNGYAGKWDFKSDTGIKSSTICQKDSELGYLCNNGDSISIKDKCDGSPLSGIVSGFVGTTAYLVDGSGTVYSFSGSAFVKDGSAKLTKLTKEKAFVGEAVQPVTYPDDNTTEASNHSVGVIIGACVGIVLLCVAFFGITCFVDPKYVKVRAAINKFKNKNKESKESDHHHKLDDRNSSNKKHSSKREGSSSSKSKSKSRKSHSSRRKSKNGTKSKHNTHKLPGKSILTSGKTTGKTSAGGSHGRRGHSAGQEVAGSRGGRSRSRSRSRTRRPSGGHSRGRRGNGSAQAQTGGHHQQHHRHQQNTTDRSPTTTPHTTPHTTPQTTPHTTPHTTPRTTPRRNRSAGGSRGGGGGGGRSRTTTGNHSPRAQVHAQQPMQTVVHTAAHTPAHTAAHAPAPTAAPPQTPVQAAVPAVPEQPPAVQATAPEPAGQTTPTEQRPAENPPAETAAAGHNTAHNAAPHQTAAPNQGLMPTLINDSEMNSEEAIRRPVRPRNA